jgi:hypothetical protein
MADEIEMGDEMKSYYLRSVSALLPLVSSLLLTNSALAIDLLGSQGIDSTSGMSVKSAETIDEGAVNVGVGYSRYKNFGLFGESKIEKITSQSLRGSYGLNDSLELGLSVVQTTESADLDVREEMFSDSDGKFKPAGFSEGSLGLKFNFNTDTNFSSGIALDVGSKADNTAAATASRTTSPTGGWLALVTIKAPELVSLHLNAGMHYRYPERLATYKVQNETVYGAGLAVHLGDYVTLFGQTEGRTFQVKNTEETDSKYKKIYSATNSAGFKLSAGSADLAISSGKEASGKEFGSAQNVIKVSLAYTFGSSANSGSSDEEMADDEEPVVPIRQQLNKKPRTLEDDVKEVNFVNDMEDGNTAPNRDIDDFELMEQKQRKEKGQKKLTQEELADQELEKLRRMEVQQKQQQERSRRVESESARKKNKRAFESENSEYKKLYKDVGHEVEEIPTVTQDEVEWKGLEE